VLDSALMQYFGVAILMQGQWVSASIPVFHTTKHWQSRYNWNIVNSTVKQQQS